MCLQLLRFAFVLAFVYSLLQCSDLVYLFVILSIICGFGLLYFVDCCRFVMFTFLFVCLLGLVVYVLLLWLLAVIGALIVLVFVDLDACLLCLVLICVVLL